MPQRVPLPPLLTGSVFAAKNRELHGLGETRLRASDLQHPFQGVRSIDADLESALGRCLAYAPLLRDGDVFSHITAAELLEMPLPPGLARDTQIHVAVLRGASRPRTRGVVGHELRDARFRTELRYGLPIVSAADVWCQLGGLLHPNDLVAVGDFIISGLRTDARREPPLASMADLHAAAARNHGKRGARAIRWAIPLLRTPVDSRMETLLRLLLIASGFPEPIVNDATLVDGGTLVLHPDLKWPQWRIVFEYEGDGHREDKRRFRGDITRKEKFEDSGWRVIRVTADDLFVDTPAFIARVRRIVAGRS